MRPLHPFNHRTLICFLISLVPLFLLVSHASTQPAGFILISTATPTQTATPPTANLTPWELLMQQRPKPLNDPAKYRLAELNQQKALDLITALDQEWNRMKHGLDWIYAQSSIDGEKEVLALAEQEALARFPTLPDQEKTSWKIALDLAVSGHQEATPRIAALLQSALNRQPSLIDHSFSDLQVIGFSFDVQEAPNLFPGQPGTWIVEVHKADKVGGGEGAGGGAVFSIHKSAAKTFQVFPVGGYWIAFWGEDFSVTRHTTTARSNPQISIYQSASHGTPAPSMAESWLCMYQFWDNEWKPVLTNTKSESRGTVGTDAALDKSCFVVRGFSTDLSFVSGRDGVPDTAQITSLGDGYSCDWRITYQFIWENGAYQQQAVVMDQTPGEMFSSEALCFSNVWYLGGAVQNKKEVILIMENTLRIWPELAAQDAQDQHIRTGLYADPDFYREVLLQLGRFYALSGDLKSARVKLSPIADDASGIRDRWVYIARHYLSHLDAIDLAEEGFTRDTHTDPCPRCGWYDRQGAIFGTVMEDLSAKGSLQTDKKEIRSLINTADPSCYGGENHYYCAQLFYMLGLANELDGNTSEAVNAYWLVWRNYPDSMYAFAAQKKLEKR